VSAPEPVPLEPGYALRRATVFDLRAVYRLERLIFPRDAYPYADLFMLFMMPGVLNLKIVAPDGSLAAFVSAMRAIFNRERAWIVTIGVHPAHRRHGLAKYLMAVAERRMKVPDMRLTVREGNFPAITLYRSIGYRVVDRRPGYYRDGETGLVMEKNLSVTSSPET
jgi:ribosomal protein S18 acetylase RimI-like enzyme